MADHGSKLAHVSLDYGAAVGVRCRGGRWRGSDAVALLDGLLVTCVVVMSIMCSRQLVVGVMVESSRCCPMQTTL